jgi:hypothetical protein
MRRKYRRAKGGATLILHARAFIIAGTLIFF